MGTNYYFFRPLTEDETNAIKLVGNLYGDQDIWTPPEPLAVPESIREATRANSTFQRNRVNRGDVYFGSGSRYQNHIGKRSAAGLYCWDCQMTLCIGGITAVHKSGKDWYEACPKCRQKPKERNRAVMMELGFAKPALGAIQGVSSCSSFSWALDDASFHEWAARNGDHECIRDEYGGLFTPMQFEKMLLLNCPIQFRDNIGIEFS